ncbi:MAG: FKBP-type peptidyl-prolyl cis-trans isomerase [Thermoplasmatota archaeon]
MAAATGDTIQVHYTGRLTTGQVFDSSRERDPLTVQLGAGQVIAGFENALVGMEEGDTTTATLAPEQAYGEHDERLVRKVSHEDLKSDALEVGVRLALQREDGMVMEASVTAMDDEGITLDFNHELAGKTLVFDLEVVSIQKGE